MELNERLEWLIINGVKSSGSYDPKVALTHFEEQLTGCEYVVVNAFLNWCHINGQVFGPTSIRRRWKEFLLADLAALRIKDGGTEKTSKYLVTVTRTAHGTRDFLVTGSKDENHASRVARDKAGNYEFSEKTSDYVVDGVIEVDETASIGVQEIKA